MGTILMGGFILLGFLLLMAMSCPMGMSTLLGLPSSSKMPPRSSHVSPTVLLGGGGAKSATARGGMVSFPLPFLLPFLGMALIKPTSSYFWFLVSFSHNRICGLAVCLLF